MKPIALAVLCMMLVGGGFILGLMAAFSALQPSASPVFPEYVAFSDLEYGVGSNGWIAFKVNNEGIGTVTLVKIYVNNVKQTLVVPSLPLSIDPDSDAVLNVTMSSLPGQDFRIDLFTSQGNKFSMLGSVPSGGQAGVMLYEANIRFYNVTGVEKIDIDIGNAGTSDTQIVQVYVGTSKSMFENQTIAPLNLPSGSIQRITIVYDWIASTAYYFRVISSFGETLEIGPEIAPKNT